MKNTIKGLFLAVAMVSSSASAGLAQDNVSLSLTLSDLYKVCDKIKEGSVLSGICDAYNASRDEAGKESRKRIEDCHEISRSERRKLREKYKNDPKILARIPNYSGGVNYNDCRKDNFLQYQADVIEGMLKRGTRLSLSK